MKHNGDGALRPFLLFCCMIAMFRPTAYAAVAPDAFLKEFVRNYENQAFEMQGRLVKENRASLPGAVGLLITRAADKELAFEERVRLLNTASKLAYMNFHWHGDDSLIKKVDPLIGAALKKEEARVAELMKWKNTERILGNFVMKKHDGEMAKKGLPPVLYPHWLHRIMYECKVCHDSIFKMARWENNLSQQAIEGGRQCGTCHNGTVTFSAVDKGNCTKCHIVGRLEAQHLHKPEAINNDWIKQIAERAGAKWRPENLPDGKLILDRFGFVDWVELKRRHAFAPISSLDDSEEKIRTNKIVFKSQNNFVSDVTFDHEIHSDWINCSTCHPSIFEPELGGNNVKMAEFSKGRFCGHCHGKVSFTFADCLRCHKKSDRSRDKNARPGEILLHKGKMAKTTPVVRETK